MRRKRRAVVSFGRGTDGSEPLDADFPESHILFDWRERKHLLSVGGDRRDYADRDRSYRVELPGYSRLPHSEVEAAEGILVSAYQPRQIAVSPTAVHQIAGRRLCSVSTADGVRDRRWHVYIV